MQCHGDTLWCTIETTRMRLRKRGHWKQSRADDYRAPRDFFGGP